MCIDLLPEKLLQTIKKKKKLYEQNSFATKSYIGITITAQ